MRRRIFCVDSVSFYASCECAARNLNPYKTKLVVLSNLQDSGALVLAATPPLKRLGIKTGSRRFHIDRLPWHERRHVLYAEARMSHYLNVSVQIVHILHQFAPPEAIRVYSVDETLVDLTGTERLFGNDDHVARLIRSTVFRYTGVPVTIGIGSNNVLAKLVLDLHGKKTGVASCALHDVERLIHPAPIEKMWGVGAKMAVHLHRLGIDTIGDLARYPLDVLHDKFGVIGAELWHHAWGIDESPTILPASSLFGAKRQRPRTIGHGITLMKDYTTESSIRLVLQAIAVEVGMRTRQSGLVGGSIHLGVRYTRTSERRGFSKQKKLARFTADEREFLPILFQLFLDAWDETEAVRYVSVALGKLEPRSEHVQLSLFEDEWARARRFDFLDLVDQLNVRFGRGTIRPASSLLKDSPLRTRQRLIGGHKQGGEPS
ncbi:MULTISPECIES: DNA polymerase [unclassified Exiguobacterium]|uniref:Y-family DNA polymerase n=1 Tax=unclassified Exiguobacterium TaxID=2644629 RepID=UPI001040A859|nr:MULTISPECIES: DNA polymerase [unclassified Exiguobacterium]TCI47952.1 DNA polymerase [Exiguobacterium sp. SH5S32]TCI54834.1 DNA polymerase [Exiguobacterium sp. SH1S4]TCI74631.1 DNA polymerase [Exiguobacterium sp. SH1S1]